MFLPVTVLIRPCSVSLSSLVTTNTYTMLTVCCVIKDRQTSWTFLSCRASSLNPVVVGVVTFTSKTLRWLSMNEVSKLMLWMGRR